MVTGRIHRVCLAESGRSVENEGHADLLEAQEENPAGLQAALSEVPTLPVGLQKTADCDEVHPEFFQTESTRSQAQAAFEAAFEATRLAGQTVGDSNHQAKHAVDQIARERHEAANSRRAQFEAAEPDQFRREQASQDQKEANGVREKVALDDNQRVDHRRAHGQQEEKTRF